MKFAIRQCVFIAAFFAILASLQAKDGVFFSDTPPITVRFTQSPLNYQTYAAITNTSDSILHAIVITANVDGIKESATVIDTILPHKTAMLDLFEFYKVISLALGDKDLKAVKSEVTLTCKDYSKPLEVKEIWNYTYKNKK